MHRVEIALVGLWLVAQCCVWAAEGPLVDGRATGFRDFAPLAQGWTTANGALVGESPAYYSLPETARGDFTDDSWTYHTVYPVPLWRYALAGKPEWTDYTVECALKIEKPAPTKGFRGGETFFNYQWGLEAVGSDAAVVVRYRGPDDYYMARISSAYGHVELWKTHGGVVQVKRSAFEAGKPYRLRVTASGPWLTVAVDGKELIRYCDPVEPVLSGKVGVAVRESRVAFPEFKVVATEPVKDSAPKHTPGFRVREWVGKKYIFDGDEPIGWFFWNPTEGMELREVKLMPGLMPMLMPCVGVASYDYEPDGALRIMKEGDGFAFSAKQRGKNDAFECSAEWALSYEPERGYVWDKRVRFVALKDKAVSAFPEIDDPFYYQLVAPQTDKLPKGRRSPNYCILERNDGKLIAFPSAHHLWTDGLADHSKSIIRPDGCAVPTIDGWGVAVQAPSDNKRSFYIAFCHWGLDLHLVAAGAAPPAKGEVFEGHLRYMLWDRARVREALAKGVLPDPSKPNPQELFNNVEPVNRLQSLSPGLTGESVRLWTGAYKVDRTIGRNDSLCMRIDAADIKARKSAPYGDDRPNIWQGPSYWTGPYLAPRYRIGVWVKADQFKGKVTLIADGILRPKPRDLKEYKADLAIEGKCDWTLLSFETDMPRNAYSWVLRIDPEGVGVVWVDDIEITPVK